jgi:hypothetical protein
VDHILSLAKPQFTRSLVAGHGGGDEETNDRTSSYARMQRSAARSPRE